MRVSTPDDTERGRNNHQSYHEETMQEGEMHKASERDSGTDIAGGGAYLNEQWKLNGRLRGRPRTDECGEATPNCWVVAKSHKHLQAIGWLSEVIKQILVLMKGVHT